MYTPFLVDANQFFIDRFGFTNMSAGRLIAIPYLTSVIISPLIGMVIDKVGNRRFFIIVTCCTFIASHILFGTLPTGSKKFPNYYSIIPLLLLGSSFALYSCAILTCIQFVVEERIIGTAFGIMAMCENLALSTFPVISAMIIENEIEIRDGFRDVSFFFVAIGFFDLLLASSLYFVDTKRSNLLD